MNIQSLELVIHMAVNKIQLGRNFDSLEWVPLLDVAAGSGAVLMNTLAVEAAQQGFMEGCVHIYTPRNSTPFPGLLLATGLEDYCESSNGLRPRLSPSVRR